MAEFELTAEVRAVRGKRNRQLRKEGFVPGIVYGPSNDPISVQFPYRAVEVTLMDAGGTNLIDIMVDGKAYPSLAREVQRDVVRGDILHVEFMAVDATQRIRRGSTDHHGRAEPCSSRSRRDPDYWPQLINARSLSG